MTYNSTYRFLLSRHAISGPRHFATVGGSFFGNLATGLWRARGTKPPRLAAVTWEGASHIRMHHGIRNVRTRPDTESPGPNRVVEGDRFPPISATVLAGGRCSRPGLAWGYCLGSGQATVYFDSTSAPLSGRLARGEGWDIPAPAGAGTIPRQPGHRTRQSPCAAWLCRGPFLRPHSTHVGVAVDGKAKPGDRSQGQQAQRHRKKSQSRNGHDPECRALTLFRAGGGSTDSA